MVSAEWSKADVSGFHVLKQQFATAAGKTEVLFD
jgi:hypothetical protein